jgi:mannose-6-phosphate isomerase
MQEISLYPLRFAPIYQYRLWGGRRLAHLLSTPLPSDKPVGEAWILSDRDDHSSVIANGSVKGKTIGQVLRESPHELLGNLAGHVSRFPLLLKFLDVSQKLSVQVHPSDAHKELIPVGDSGKTEGWVVLEAGREARIYAGLKPGLSANILRQALADGTVVGELASFRPKPGDGVLIPAGTVHSLSDVVVFEVQENSDVTFRLYDWDHVDPETGERRSVQVAEAMACIDFGQGSIGPSRPMAEESMPVMRERLIHCDYFAVSRIDGDMPFTVGVTQMPRVLVCLAGHGHVEHAGNDYAFGKGDVLLLPAVVGTCLCRPHGTVSVLEIAIPESRVTP